MEQKVFDKNYSNRYSGLFKQDDLGLSVHFSIRDTKLYLVRRTNNKYMPIKKSSMTMEISTMTPQNNSTEY